MSWCVPQGGGQVEPLVLWPLVNCFAKFSKIIIRYYAENVWVSAEECFDTNNGPRLE